MWMKRRHAQHQRGQIGKERIEQVLVSDHQRPVRRSCLKFRDLPLPVKQG
jgi:hypothetical protein